MSALIAARVSCMFLLLLGTFCCGILPLALQKILLKCDCVGPTCKKSCRARRGKVATTALIFFGGGVLLGTCLLHLLPEAREGLGEDHHDHDLGEKENLTTTTTTTQTSVFYHPTGGEGHHHESFPLPEFVVCCGFFAVYLFEELIHHFMGGHTHVPTENKAIRSLSRSSSCSTSNPAELVQSGGQKIKTDQESCQESCPQPPPPKFSLTALLTVAALSFHSLFEGFAVGLQDSPYNTWMVFAAISVHKFVIAFVVGLEVLASGSRTFYLYLYMVVFSLMSPIGMAIAMITQSEVEESNPVVVGALNAIATGTLLYVTFFEILNHDEEHKNIPSWLQLVSTFCGFALVCLMQYGSTFA